MNIINKLLLNATSESSAVSELRHWHPLFQSLTFQGSRAIFQRSSIVRLRSTQLLFREGMPELVVYIILCGRMLVHTADLGLLGVAGTGDSLGEESLFCRKYVARYTALRVGRKRVWPKEAVACWPLKGKRWKG